MSLQVYIDNSNVWIGAKKWVNRQKGFDTTKDHRVRIDVGKLCKIVANGRPVAKCSVYGSRPPPNDTLWANIQAKGIEVKVHDRSHITGKEKKVDGQLLTDLLRAVYFLHVESLVVLMTGDADMIPSLEAILNDSAVTVELYSWKFATTYDFAQLISKYPRRVKKETLERYGMEFIYTSWKFPSTKLKKGYHTGLVFTVSEDFSIDAWMNKLEKFVNWPFQYFRYGAKLVAVFTRDLELGDFGWFDACECVKTMEEENFKLPSCQKFETWDNFAETEMAKDKSLLETNFYQ